MSRGGPTALVALAVLAAGPAVGQERAARLAVHTLAGPIEAGSGGLEVDADGNVYTADFGATLGQGPPGTRVWRITPHQIYELTLQGELTLLAGSGERGLDDGAGDVATLSLPNDVALSPDGTRLYWNDVGELDPTDRRTLRPTWIRYVDLSGS